MILISLFVQIYVITKRILKILASYYYLLIIQNELLSQNNNIFIPFSYIFFLQLKYSAIGLPQGAKVRRICIQLFRQRLSKKSVKAFATMPKGSLTMDNNKPKSREKYPINFNKSSESIARHLKSSLYGRNIKDSELLLKFIGHFPDNFSALSRTLLGFFWTTFVETAVYDA